MARTKRVTGYIGPDLEQAWSEYVANLGISESAAVEWAIRAEIRRHTGENSKERMLEQHSASLGEILDILHQMQRTLQMLHAEKWTQIAPGDGRVQVSIKLDDGDLRRLLQAVKSEAQRND